MTNDIFHRIQRLILWFSIVFGFAYMPCASATATTETLLHSFHDGSVANDGEMPLSAVIQASDGNFYGTTTDGGSAGY